MPTMTRYDHCMSILITEELEGFDGAAGIADYLHALHVSHEALLKAVVDQLKHGPSAGRSEALKEAIRQAEELIK